MQMSIERAIAVMAPGVVPKSPAEYEAARKMAVRALTLCLCNAKWREAVLKAGEDNGDQT